MSREIKKNRVWIKWPWVRLLAFIYTAGFVWMLLPSGYEICTTTEISGAESTRECRALTWTDPAVLVGAFLGLTLWGVQFKSVSFDKAKLEFQASAKPPAIMSGDGSARPVDEHEDDDDFLINLLLLGTASELNHTDSLLVIFYRVQGGEVVRHWYAGPSRARYEEREMRAIAGSREMLDRAVEWSESKHIEWMMLAPFPDSDTRLRLCIATPVKTPESGCLGTIMAVGVQAGTEDLQLGRLMIETHMKKSAIILGRMLNPEESAAG